MLKQVGIVRLVQNLNDTPKENPPLTARELRDLTAFYREDNARLSRLLGGDYSHWLADGSER
jgi:hypothetical protein